MTNFKEAKMEALEFLRNYTGAGMIATVDNEGQPFLSSVHFAMGNEFDLFFITTTTTHKSKNILINNKVAFTVGSGPEYISVMIRGIAAQANSEEESRAVTSIRQKVNEKISGWPLGALEDLRGQNLIVYKINPNKVTFLNINSTQEPKSTGNHLYHLVD